MTADDFKGACYYAVREDFNAQNDPAYTEQNPKFDRLIREAIRFLNAAPEMPYMCLVEAQAIANCERRRLLSPMDAKPTAAQIQWAINAQSKIRQKRTQRSEIQEYIKLHGWARLEAELKYWLEQTKPPGLRQHAPHPDEKGWRFHISFASDTRSGVESVVASSKDEARENFLALNPDLKQADLITIQKSKSGLEHLTPPSTTSHQPSTKVDWRARLLATHKKIS